MLRDTLDQRGLPPKEKGEAVEPLISIIVPVYNVLPYLWEALDSAVHQTWKNLEILIIDDGSTDGSGEVCDEYLSDPRVKVIHQENKGLSGARNTGLDLMTGEYVAFLDPDDAYYPEMIERLFRALAASCADLAVCGYDVFVTEGSLKEARRIARYVYKDKTQLTGNKAVLTRKEVVPTGREPLPTGKEVVPKSQETRHTGGEVASTRNKMLSADHEVVLTGHEALQALAEGHIPPSVWNKLYSMQLWDDLRYPEGCVYEDLSITHQILNRCAAAAVVPEALVYYRSRKNSITETNKVENTRDNIRAYTMTLEYLEQVQPPLPQDSIQVFRENALRTMISHWVRIPKQESIQEEITKLKTAIVDYAEKVRPFRNMKTKAVWLIFMHSPGMMAPTQICFRRMKQFPKG